MSDAAIPETRPRGHDRLAWAMALGAGLLLAACGDVGSTFKEFTTGRPTEATTDPAVEAARAEGLYREGLALRDAGRPDLAVHRLHEAADLGHAGAAYTLGMAFNAGAGVDRDPTEGADWINAAAAGGDARARFLVGAAHYAGAGVPQDFEKARGFLGPAARDGHARAQFLLGKAFANGHGAPRDPAWAARWYGKAAAQGHVEAQFAYGVVNGAGQGLPVNLVRAYLWLSLAAARDHPRADEVRRAIGRRMTASQVARARALIDGFETRAPATFADGPTIAYLQHALNRLGFDAGPADGVMGARTRAAIAAYQTDRALAPDGKPSPELMERIRADVIGD